MPPAVGRYLSFVGGLQPKVIQASAIALTSSTKRSSSSVTYPHLSAQTLLTRSRSPTRDLWFALTDNNKTPNDLDLASNTGAVAEGLSVGVSVLCRVDVQKDIAGRCRPSNLVDRVPFYRLTSAKELRATTFVECLKEAVDGLGVCRPSTFLELMVWQWWDVRRAGEIR